MINNTPNALSQGWEWDLFQPQPHQDSDLLKYLGFLPGLREFLILRQVYALEHATVWVLSEMAQKAQGLGIINNFPADNETLGGLSTEKGFYLYGQVSSPDLHRAVSQSLQRLKSGEWRLAIHPRCGTNLSVSLALTTGLALGAHLFLPRGPIEQLLGLTLATAIASQLSPDLGSSTQKYLTTAIPFNLELGDITVKSDFWGRSGYFIGVKWQD